jgi:hypothetical protein
MIRNQLAVVKQTQIPKILTSNIVKILKNIIKNSPKKEYFDGENVLKINQRCYLMYFDSNFDKQTPHYHIGNPMNFEDLYSNGGGERNLYGFSDTGIGLRTPSQDIYIKPNSLCHIHFPGSPPTIHQFYGINSNRNGTSLFSIHNNKKIEYGRKNMETYTVFSKI